MWLTESIFILHVICLFKPLLCCTVSICIGGQFSSFLRRFRGRFFSSAKHKHDTPSAALPKTFFYPYIHSSMWLMGSICVRIFRRGFQFDGKRRIIYAWFSPPFGWRKSSIKTNDVVEVINYSPCLFIVVEAINYFLLSAMTFMTNFGRFNSLYGRTDERGFSIHRNWKTAQ